MHHELIYTKPKTALLGYLLSILFLLAATLSILRSIPYAPIIAVFLGLAQTAVQFICFYGLNREEKPRWNLILFLFMAIVSIIIVAGSLWIMYNLDYRMMDSP